jgi:hypothetical protein
MRATLQQWFSKQLQAQTRSVSLTDRGASRTAPLAGEYTALVRLICLIVAIAPASHSPVRIKGKNVSAVNSMLTAAVKIASARALGDVTAAPLL